MSRRAGKVASPRDDWQTPRWLLDALRAELGPIGLDPCTSDDNPTGAEVFATRNGLETHWMVRPIGTWVYVNPPFSAANEWAEKVMYWAERGLEIGLLLPASVNSKRFHALTKAADVVAFFGRRVSYVDPSTGTERRGADFDSACWYFGPREWKFARALRPHATTLGRKTGIVAQEAA